MKMKMFYGDYKNYMDGAPTENYNSETKEITVTMNKMALYGYLVGKFKISEIIADGIVNIGFKMGFKELLENIENGPKDAPMRDEAIKGLNIVINESF